MALTINCFEDNKYYYIDKGNNICSEDKNKSFFAFFKRSIMSLVGLRDYNLVAIVIEINKKIDVDKSVKEKFIRKTFSVIKFSLEETDILINLLDNKAVELAPIHDLSFNKKLTSNSVVKKIFTSLKKEVVFEHLRYVTYKSKLLQNVQVPPLNNEKSIYKIDKMANFFEYLDKYKNIRLKDSDQVFQECKKAYELRKKIFSNVFNKSKADLIAYDIKKVESIGLWSYYSIEKLYFKFSGSFIGHVAREYLCKNVNRVSHMMEEYDYYDLQLYQLLFKRYQLVFSKLINANLVDRLISMHGDNYLEVIRTKFDDISSRHIESNSQGKLKKAQNSILNQISTPFLLDRLIFGEIDHYKQKEYKEVMLCSEYLQMSIVNCLSLLDSELKQELGISDQDGHVIILPIDSKDRDFISPGKFFKKWLKVLEEVAKPDFLIPKPD